MEIADFHVFVNVSFAPTARGGVFMSKTANLRIVVDGLRMFVRMPDRFAG